MRIWAGAVVFWIKGGPLDGSGERWPSTLLVMLLQILPPFWYQNGGTVYKPAFQDSLTSLAGLRFLFLVMPGVDLIHI